ncbi:MAG: hypothetical protein Q9219_002921 [cf. Caloplaca sp. 3 TL-2023]
MTLRDLLKKREKIRDDARPKQPAGDQSPPTAQFTFMRSDTNTQEVISPPSFTDDHEHEPGKDTQPHAKRFSRFRSSSSASTVSNASDQREKRLSRRLHLSSQSRSSSISSSNVPSDLPPINDALCEDEEKEAQWEKRATILAQENAVAKQRRSMENSAAESTSRPALDRSISDAKGDVRRIYIRPEENIISPFLNLLYLLTPISHGWGITPDPSLAITYLSQAASNSALVESTALSSGMKKGGAAKGELVLAIYELANSFRHGWGVRKDPVAARSYYETAANLGDTDAMNEVARCYEEGLGGKKDRVGALIPLCMFA